jgi:O-antigen biosynthesis protein WbqP
MKILLFGKCGQVGWELQRSLAALGGIQYDLLKLTSGITGWAQINGRDEISIEQKVQFDTYYLERQSTLFDLEILFKTFIQSALRRNISH